MSNRNAAEEGCRRLRPGGCTVPASAAAAAGDHRQDTILVRKCAAFIEQFNAAIGEEERILVIATERARNSGALPPQVLSGRFVRWFANFGSNPNLASACEAAALVSEFRPSVIVGLGGGSAMDVAKAARILPPNIAAALEMIRLDAPLRRIHGRHGTPRAVVVPTLSGSGAEVTQFATLFHDGRKVSVDDAGIRPDRAIIYPSLAATAPHLPTSAATLDAVCHAVESAWSLSATALSRRHSERALAHLAVVRWKTDGAYSLEDRYTMAAGAVSAGRAINLTRTTAAHASAYMLTVHYGIPHGVACGLNMQWVARINAATSVIEPEVAAIFERSLGVAATDLPEYFHDRLSGAGWPTHLGGYGVNRSDLPALALDATQQARLRNNPVDLTTADVEDGMNTIF